MVDLLTLAIGIGLAVSLLFSEFFAIAAGGMIVPGYLALSITQPLNVAITVLAALITFGIVHGLSSFVIVYGRRRTVAMILVGYLVGATLSAAIAGHTTPSGNEMRVIGHIIPGLIAIWMARQGVVVTLTSMITASIIVRLLLVIFVGLEFAT